MALESSLRDNVKRVFRGLAENDFDILKFFYQRGPKSKYEASNELKQIPRATIYRKINALRDKGFLTVVDSKQFKRGSLTSEVEFLMPKSLKGYLAVLGTDINIHKTLKEFTDLQSEIIREIFSPEKLLEIYNKIFETINDDLTDTNLDFNTLFFSFIINNPEYVRDLLNQSGLRGEERIKHLKELLDLAEKVQKEYFGKGVEP